MKNQKLKHLQLIADAFIDAGYEVQEPKKNDAGLAIWGYVKPEGLKRRKKCFVEISCTVFAHPEGIFSFWINPNWDVDNTNQTFDIQIFQEKNASHLQNADELIYAVSRIIEPIKKRKVA